MKKACDFSKGPFFSNFDISLQKLKVKRQAYQGGTFIGNHVHKLLKVKKKHCQEVNYLITCYY